MWRKYFDNFFFFFVSRGFNLSIDSKLYIFKKRISRSCLSSLTSYVSLRMERGLMRLLYQCQHWFFTCHLLSLFKTHKVEALSQVKAMWPSREISNLCGFCHTPWGARVGMVYRGQECRMSPKNPPNEVSHGESNQGPRSYFFYGWRVRPTCTYTYWYQTTLPDRSSLVYAGHLITHGLDLRLRSRPAVPLHPDPWTSASWWKQVTTVSWPSAEGAGRPSSAAMLWVKRQQFYVWTPAARSSQTQLLEKIVLSHMLWFISL